MDLLAPTHLLLILIVALLVLGPKRLPEAARSLGRGLRDFREAMNEYHPGHLLDDDTPRVHPPEAEESELHREPPVVAATAQAAPEVAHDANGAGGSTVSTQAESGASHDPPNVSDDPSNVSDEPTLTHEQPAAGEEDTQVLDGEIVPGPPSPRPAQG